VARRLQNRSFMQIPYDLEFVENRPTVSARAVAIAPSAPIWRAERPASQHDAVDRFLHWAFRFLRRFEGRS